MEKLGFIGLGIMGQPMAKNLLKNGYAVNAFGINAAKLDSVVSAGGVRAASNADVGRHSDIILTMLPDGPEVEDIILGPQGLLSAARAGSIVVDMSSINPLTSQKLASACASRGVHFLDAPVSGGEPKAIDGTLAFMVGGETSVFKRVEPILRCMGSSVTLVGPVGAGNVTKLSNQIMVACNIAAMGEALALATRCGLEAQVVIDALKGGLAGSAVLQAKGPMVAARNFKPGFKIRLHHKDLKNALITAESVGMPLPLTALVQQELISLLRSGKGELDHSAIATFVEVIGHVEIGAPNAKTK